MLVWAMQRPCEVQQPVGHVVTLQLPVPVPPWQAPLGHDWLRLQATHAAPLIPHAETLVPALHAPDAVQHPEQLDGPHGPWTHAEGRAEAPTTSDSPSHLEAPVMRPSL